MVYLDHILFPDRDQEFDFFLSVKKKCYNDFYPFQILSAIDLTRLDLESVTILHGGNGSGKTTALNVIAEAAGADRDSAYNRSSFYEDYVQLCRLGWRGEKPEECRIITSDDVFDYMLDIRHVNGGIDRQREKMFDDYQNVKEEKNGHFQLRSLEGYEELKRVNQIRRWTSSRYVKENLPANVMEHSNGENAFLYFTQKIRENGLYILDEPENSLSPEKQRELVRFLEESVRFFRCQFIIATHSPFLLGIRDAKIYDLDETPVEVKNWTDVKNVRQYYEFFREHKQEFE